MLICAGGYCFHTTDMRTARRIVDTAVVVEFHDHADIHFEGDSAAELWAALTAAAQAELGAMPPRNLSTYSPGEEHTPPPGGLADAYKPYTSVFAAVHPERAAEIDRGSIDTSKPRDSGY